VLYSVENYASFIWFTVVENGLKKPANYGKKPDISAIAKNICGPVGEYF
jgi:hypothetical protein